MRSICFPCNASATSVGSSSFPLQLSFRLPQFVVLVRCMVGTQLCRFGTCPFFDIRKSPSVKEAPSAVFTSTAHSEKADTTNSEHMVSRDVDVDTCALRLSLPRRGSARQADAAAVNGFGLLSWLTGHSKVCWNWETGNCRQIGKALAPHGSLFGPVFTPWTMGARFKLVYYHTRRHCQRRCQHVFVPFRALIRGQVECVSL